MLSCGIVTFSTLYRCPVCTKRKVRRVNLPRVFLATYECGNCGRRFRWRENPAHSVLVEVDKNVVVKRSGGSGKVVGEAKRRARQFAMR